MSDRDFWRAVDTGVKGHRARKLAEADTEGWTQHTPWHYSREFNGERVEWWPSGGKARYRGRMIYGHAKVAELIERLSNNITAPGNDDAPSPLRGDTDDE